MNKKEIFKKAQSSQKDEREQQIEMKSFRIGWIGVTVTMLVLIGFRFYFNESAQDILMILMAQTSAASFYQYKHINNKRIYLFAGIVSLIAVFLAFAGLLSAYGVY